MKKMLALVSFLILAAACTTEPPPTNSPAPNANKAATSLLPQFLRQTR